MHFSIYCIFETIGLHFCPSTYRIYWDYCYFCMPAQTPTFSQNNGNYAKLYNIMQNVVSSRITQNSHKFLIFNRIYAARNLDIP